ncbi:hypothetical protein [Coprobacillus cateniformis]|jgi:O-antigen/teichoic acid export membrane protein|uniref:hypothetical protein n=1 Tax=Coprobacillus cateniformis TaxID=100884 RepID=UPI0024A7DF48|nr:hypothetical protein [Coprobacillus cateniformis]
MSSQFWYLSFFELALTIILSIMLFAFNLGVNKQFILFLTIANIIFVIPKTMLSYLLQVSNRIKEYSLIVILEKVIYCLLTLCILLFGFTSYKPLIFADVLGKFCALFLGVYYCKDIVFSKMETIHVSLIEAWLNISVGIKLLVANIAGMLILGIIRMAIEYQWDIETFGKVSLAISVSNLLMVFINSVGIVLFPMIKRMDKDKLNDLYFKMRDILMVLLFGMLVFYYPLQYILKFWLPNYVDSFAYLALLFPMCIYESKMSMLINTYLKAFRKEKQLLLINSISVLLSFIFSGISVFLLKNLILTVIMIVLLFAFRCIACELLLSNYMEKSVINDILKESVLCMAFMCISWNMPSLFAFFSYLIIFLIYIFSKRESYYYFIEKLIIRK